MMQRLKWLMKSKVFLLCALGVLVGGSVLYARTHPPSEPLRYVLTPAMKGTLVVSLRGSGQVLGQNQLEIKPTVSGVVRAVLVAPGEGIKEGDALFEIDRTLALRAVRDAAQSVKDATISLQSAELSLKKIKQPPEALSLLQAQNSVRQAERALVKLQEGPDVFALRQAETDLENQRNELKYASDQKTPLTVREAYDDAIPTLKTTIQSFQQIILDTESVLNIRDGMPKDPYIEFVRDTGALVRATNEYLPAKNVVEALRKRVDVLPVTNASVAEINSVIQDMERAITILDPYLRSVAEVASTALPSSSRTQATIDGFRTTIQADRSTLASKQAGLTALKRSFTTAEESHESIQAAVLKAELALEKLKAPVDPGEVEAAKERKEEAEKSLAKLQEGPDEIEILTAENTIAQRRASVASAREKLADAQESLNDYTIRAPFDGVAARVASQRGDTVSASTAVATLLTNAKIAQLSVNEVDAAKLKVGQKATLTFDAISELSIAGAVYEVDSIGTVSQGVVNYVVKILFQTQDERVKSGMSVSASIITDLRTDVVLLPNAAIRRTGDAATVQVVLNASSTNTAGAQGIPSATPPEERLVETGISNEEMTEVTQGIREGELVVTRTIDPNTATLAPRTATGAGAATGGLRIPGLGGAGGGGGFGAGGAVRPTGR
jgi:RND family efflux transporter MFP subunit